MHWVILSALFAVSYAAKLDNAYLPPPPGAKQAGGDDSNLELPLEPPYIDPYSNPDSRYNRPDHVRNQVFRNKPPSSAGQGSYVPPPNQYGRGIDFDRVNNIQHRNSDYLENEDEIRRVHDSTFGKKGRFLSGSYSYTGPDNVLVTVTYTADDKRQGRSKGDDKRGRDGGRSRDGSRQDRDRDQNRDQDRDRDYSEESSETGEVPTPPTLPQELQRAFDFHQKKHQPQDEKKGYQYGKPQSQRPKGDRPEINEGYSYPKQGQNQ